MHKGRGHFWVSCVKSLIRVASCAVTIGALNVRFLAGGFLIAEILGLLEEFVDDR